MRKTCHCCSRTRIHFSQRHGQSASKVACGQAEPRLSLRMHMSVVLVFGRKGLTGISDDDVIVMEKPCRHPPPPPPRRVIAACMHLENVPHTGHDMRRTQKMCMALGRTHTCISALQCRQASSDHAEMHVHQTAGMQIKGPDLIQEVRTVPGSSWKVSL